MKEVSLKISEKMNLTIEEASAYFGIHEEEIMRILKERRELAIWRESSNTLVRRIDMERYFDSVKKDSNVRTCEKVNLSTKEAADYFGIGENLIRNLAKEHKDLGLWVGKGKVLIKRKKMEKFLDNVTSI